MKNFALVILVVLVVVLVPQVSMAQANGFVELQSVIVDGSATNQINLSLGGNLPAKNLGWFAWGVTSKGWSEAYVGLTYSPADWVSIQAGYGIETADDSGRFGATLWAGKGANSIFVAYEDGGSGSWHKLVLNHKFNTWLGAGAIDQTFLGTGPRVEVTTGKVKVWGAVLWLDGKPSSTVAVDFNF